MNHLAHAFLSPDSGGEQAGNILADFITPGGELPEPVRAGVSLHREIDAFTDRHPEFKACAQFLPQSQRRYAPVIIDVCFDFMLAENWHSYAPHPLGSLVEDRCRNLESWIEQIPLRYPGHIRRMVERRWLIDYSDPSHLDRVFDGLSRRARPGNPLEEAPDALRDNWEALHSRFASFFADLWNTFPKWRRST